MNNRYGSVDDIDIGGDSIVYEKVDTEHLPDVGDTVYDTLDKPLP